MSCALTTGFTLDCKEAIGGIKSVRFATLSDYQALSVTVTTGELKSVGSASTVFYKYALDKEESMFSDDPTAGSNKGTLYYVPTLTFILSKLDTAKRNEMQLLAKNRVVAIVETMESTPSYWVLGHTHGLDFASGTGASGTAAADLNGYTMTFTGLEPDPMVKINPSSGTVASLLTSITN